MRNTLLLFCTVIASFFTSYSTYSQPQKGKFINAAVGLGLTAPEDESDASGSGFYAQAEYIYAIRTWLSVKQFSGGVAVGYTFGLD